MGENFISIKFVITWELKFVIIHTWSLLMAVFLAHLWQACLLMEREQNEQTL
jgi:hypothetical protein